MSLKAQEILANKRLGEILKSLDFIDDNKLEEILQRQKETKMKLGEVLASMGCVDKDVVLALLGKQLGHSFIKLSEIDDIPKVVLQLIPVNIAQQHLLMPFALEGEILKIAMAEPQDEEVRAAISILTGFEVQAYITSEEEIIKSIGKYY